MSLAFSDLTNDDGIIQRIEQELGFPDAYISGDAQRLRFWTGSINLSLDKAFHIIFGADGKWQFDDSGHSKDPIITTNISESQRKYAFTTDEQSNLILELKRVFLRRSATDAYYELKQKDIQSDPEYEISSFVDGLNTEGWATDYDKTANGIILGLVPPDAVTAGLKIYINREGSYFITTDTIKTPGFAGLYHEYCVLEPCYRYARANSLVNKETFKRDVLELEKNIQEYYSRRNRDEENVMRNEPIIYE